MVLDILHTILDPDWWEERGIDLDSFHCFSIFYPSFKIRPQYDCSACIRLADVEGED